MRRQQGFALILGLLLVLLLAASVFLNAKQSTALLQAKRAADQEHALATAREMLVAYALAVGSNNHPGALPCPDMNGNGSSNNTDCQGKDVYMGRLPVSTLDIDVKSLHSVEEIWFALDDSFVDFNPPGGDLNTGDEPSLQIGGGDVRYPAVLILAGGPVETQAPERLGSNEAEDFLEGSNVDGDPLNFASCYIDECNDRVVGITKSDLLDPVRKMLLGEVRKALESFYDDHGHYPKAARLGATDGACRDELRGMLPVADGDCGESLDSLPAWIQNNGWHRWVYYGVAGSCATGSAQPCDATAPDLLSLDDDDAQAVVYGTVGVPIVSSGKGAMQNRGGTLPHNVEDYLDSPTNAKPDEFFNDPDNDDAGENDRLRAIAAPSP